MGVVTGQAHDATGVDELSDAELIERSRLEPGCFATIFDRHAGEILRYAHARLGPDLAEDIAAETFLAAFRRRDRYDPAWADARPWLYGIAVRLIGKHRRSEARYRRLLRAAPADPSAEDPGDRSACSRTGRDGGAGPCCGPPWPPAARERSRRRSC